MIDGLAYVQRDFVPRRLSVGAAYRLRYILAMEQDNLVLDGLHAQNLIVFDGVCVLCTGMVQYIIRRDKAARFHFMTAQSKTGEALYGRLGKKSGDYETFFFMADGKIYEKFDAFLAVMDRLGWPWRTLTILKPLPLPLKNWLYDRVARNRYWLFGKRDACMVPEPNVKARFLD